MTKVEREPAEGSGLGGDSGRTPRDGTSDPGHPTGAEWLWAVVGAVGATASVVLVVLTGIGASGGPVVLLLGVLVGLAVFAKSLWEILKKVSPRHRTAFGLAIGGFAVALVVIGLATRSVAPLARLPGPQDIAVAGFVATTSEAQRSFDNAASKIGEALQRDSEGSVHDYSGRVNPPLEELRSGATGALDSWAQDFVAKTESELVIGGYVEAFPSGQVQVWLGVYVSPNTVVDAGELAGWYQIGTVFLEGLPDSMAELDLLVTKIVVSLHGLTTFVEGLDAWHSGQSAEAVDMFGDVLATPRENTDGTVAGLSALFRGHAYESIAVTLDAEQRADFLEQARRDYTAASLTASIAPRAQTSLAWNTFLRVSRQCVAGKAPDEQLSAASDRLSRIEQDSSLGVLLRLTARVDLAQVEQCRSRGGADNSALLDSLLADLVELDTDSPGPEQVTRRQIKALALSVTADRQAMDSRYSDAVTTINAALALDARSDRQATWRALQAAWLLYGCHIDEAVRAQELAYAQYQIAVERGRVGAALPDAFAERFERELVEFSRQCSTD